MNIWMSVGLKEVMGCPLSLPPLFQCGDGGALREAKPAGSEAQQKKEEKTFFFFFSPCHSLHGHRMPP